MVRFIGQTFRRTKRRVKKVSTSIPFQFDHGWDCRLVDRITRPYLSHKLIFDDSINFRSGSCTKSEGEIVRRREWRRKSRRITIDNTHCRPSRRDQMKVHKLFILLIIHVICKPDQIKPKFPENPSSENNFLAIPEPTSKLRRNSAKKANGKVRCEFSSLRM